MRSRIAVAAGLSAVVLMAACSGSKAKSSTSEPLRSQAVSGSSSGSVSGASGGASPGGKSATPAPPSKLTPAKPSAAKQASASAPKVPAVNPNAPEVVEPGDIPDNQAFVTYAAVGGGYSVDVPEGWARTEQQGVVTFTDKYNAVRVQSTQSGGAPTVDGVKASGLTDVASDPTFTLLQVVPVKRKAGEGVLATFDIGSAPNKVTGKKALLSVERYVFSHNGTTVVLTLSGAKGADNVDPWKTVSNSLTWK